MTGGSFTPSTGLKRDILIGSIRSHGKIGQLRRHNAGWQIQTIRH